MQSRESISYEAHRTKDLTVGKTLFLGRSLGGASSARFAQRSHPCEGPREVVTAMSGRPRPVEKSRHFFQL